jgi:DNA-binding transcriptional ArsR family regulator
VRSRNANSLLDHVFYALSDPTRRRIVATLARGEVNLTGLVRRSRLSFAAVAKHVRVLERGRLVRRRPDPQDRRAVVFALRPRPMQAGIDWLETHRSYWQERFAELEAFVRAHHAAAAETGRRDDGPSPG